MLHCSFCGKTQKEVSKLLSGMDNTHICDRCVDLSASLLNKENTEKSKQAQKTRIRETLKVPGPRQIHDHLNEHIIGQTRAKKTISVGIYNHYKRIISDNQIPIDKSNILLIGPTGVGKTLIARTIAHMLDVPFIVTDATTLTEHGYAGDDTETLIQKLVQDANNDVQKAEIGIIYIDEIDKKAKRNDYVNLSRDVSGEGVQQSLLKLMEGTKVEVSIRAETGKAEIHYKVDTSNILFIVSGAFVGLDDVVRERIGKGKIGFNNSKISSNVPDWEKSLETQDLIKYGLIPEFIGRLPNVTLLHELNSQELIQVLTEPKYSLIKQYQALFELDHVKLEFNDDALDAIVNKAKKQGLGARGLRKVLDEILIDIQYELPDLAKQGVTKIVITKDCVLKGSPPWKISGGDTVH